MTQQNTGPSMNPAMTPDFDAVRSAWQSLSVYFAKTAQVPADPAGFEARYGGFEDAQALARFAALCGEANACAAALGDAARLRTQLIADPALLEKPQPPAFIYGETVWAARQLRDIASSFRATLERLPGLLAASSGNAAGRSELLKQVLVGNEGLLPPLVALKTDMLRFDQRIKPIQERLQAANEALSQTNMLNLANQQIGYLESSQEERAAALARARQAADGAWIGKDDKRKHYDTLLQQYQRDEFDYAGKRHFVADVDNIFAAGTAAVLAVATIANQFEKAGKVAGDARSLLMSLCTSANAEQLSDYGWVAQALGLADYLPAWSRLGDQADKFVQTALTEFKESTR